MFAYSNVDIYLYMHSFFRETAIKFNDYFEFPREFDMEPFTVQGLAKIEGVEYSSLLEVFYCYLQCILRDKGTCHSEQFILESALIRKSNIVGTLLIGLW